MMQKEALVKIGQRIKKYRKIAGLTQEQLAQAASVPYATLTKIESGAIKNPSLANVYALADALGISVVDFLMVDTYQGDDCILRIFDDVLNTLKDGETMYITGIEEQRYLAANGAAFKQYIKRLKERGIRQKLISCAGDQFTLQEEHLEYRWIPKKYFSSTPIYTYGSKVASVIWGPPHQVVILNNEALAEAYRKQFLFIWQKAKKLSLVCK